DNVVKRESIATGENCETVRGGLQETNGYLNKKHKKDLDNLGANLKGAKIGLVVPEDFDGDSIEDLKDQAGKKIVGIEPGAGVVKASEKAVKDYNLDGWEVETSSSGAMATTLGQAMKKKDDIVVTGWSPHWKFQKYDLKYLKDPKGSF